MHVCASEASLFQVVAKALVSRGIETGGKAREGAMLQRFVKKNSLLKVFHVKIYIASNEAVYAFMQHPRLILEPGPRLPKRVDLL